MATILVADDRLSNREFLVYLLVQNGRQVLEAADRAEALAITRAMQPDLAIIGLVTPTIDGYEFVCQLRTEPAIAPDASHFLYSDLSAIGGVDPGAGLWSDPRH
jgi:two-component system, cell cycle sensor histidine kinase and response regulator CckA